MIVGNFGQWPVFERGQRRNSYEETGTTPGLTPVME